MAFTSKLFYFILQICNFALFILSIALFASAVYLWITVKMLNSFILGIAILALFMFFTAFWGYSCVKYFGFFQLIYMLFLVILIVVTVILGYFVVFDQQQIVQMLTQNMTDSGDTILATRRILTKNFEITKLVVAVYLGVEVNINIYILGCHLVSSSFL
jgi:hypothetical protein